MVSPTRVKGHYWTIAPFVSHLLRPRPEPPSRAFAMLVRDPEIGPVRISGRLAVPDGADTLVLIVHGLGGSAESPYAAEAHRAAVEVGMAALRINLRGAERDGEDLYHAGLSADLAEVLRAPELQRFARVLVIGYSLGGHLVLKLATEVEDPRVAAVAAVCPPLDLDRGAAALDRPERWLYRRHVLGGLKEMYLALAQRRSYRLPAPLREVMKVGSIREWDRLTVARRFGFGTAERYYAESSVAPRLAALKVPALIVSAVADPMVPHETVEPCLAGGGRLLQVERVHDAGHVGFPADLELGVDAPRGLERQVLGWLRGRAGR